MPTARLASSCLVLVATLLLGGCAHLRAAPGGGVSRGKPSGGWLAGGVRLPPRGAGYEVLRPPAEGGVHWGTARVVSLVQRVARALSAGGAALRVGDLSAERGGQIQRHRSHRNGRDVDLLFFARDEATRAAVPAPDFVRYGRDGRSVGREAPLRFDVERNWSLVEALLRDERAGVARIFVAGWLRRMLLDHARGAGKAAWLVDRAERVLLQPGDSLPHDDHFHVRVACTTQERYLGCVDGAPLWPWLHKDWEKDDAVANDDEAVLDLMEPLDALPEYGPADPARAASLVCAPRRSFDVARCGVCI